MEVLESGRPHDDAGLLDKPDDNRVLFPGRTTYKALQMLCIFYYTKSFCQKLLKTKPRTIFDD